MKSKEYYQSLLSVYDFLLENQEGIDCKTATELAGEYWAQIAQDFRAAGAGCIASGGDFHVTQGQYLGPLAADARSALDEIGKLEADRELENRTKIESVTYARKAYDLSEKTARWQKRHLFITGAVALGQLIQWIIMIIQWISHP